jgi:hypothetical protein
MADRSLRKLVKLADGASGPMTAEVWSLASVAGFVLKQADEAGLELHVDELAFLKSFTRLVERLCEDQYRREVRS